MKMTEQADLINYGKEHHIIVRPTLVGRESAVAYSNVIQTNYHEAFRDLMRTICIDAQMDAQMVDFVVRNYRP